MCGRDQKACTQLNSRIKKLNRNKLSAPFYQQSLEIKCVQCKYKYHLFTLTAAFALHCILNSSRSQIPLQNILFVKRYSSLMQCMHKMHLSILLLTISVIQIDVACKSFCDMFLKDTQPYLCGLKSESYTPCYVGGL